MTDAELEAIRERAALDHAATAREIAWMHGNPPGLAGDVERALREAERAGRRAGEERLQEALKDAVAYWWPESPQEQRAYDRAKQLLAEQASL